MIQHSGLDSVGQILPNRGNKPSLGTIALGWTMTFKKLEDDERALFLEKARKREPAAFEPIVRHYEKPLRDWVAGHIPPQLRC